VKYRSEYFDLREIKEQENGENYIIWNFITTKTDRVLIKPMKMFMFMLMGSEYVCELLPPTGLFFIF
jgi:hypothetical protein